MDKEYENLQFAENEFFRAYSLALKTAGSNKADTKSGKNTHRIGSERIRTLRRIAGRD